MKTVPIARPGVGPSTPTGPSPSQKDAKARAVAILQGNSQPQTPTPVPPTSPIPLDANNISPEDLSAVKQTSGQNDTDVEVTSKVVEEPVKETTTEKVVEEKQPSSSQLAILARKERALRAKAQQQEQAIKEREAALKAREEALAARDNEYKQGYVSKDRLKQDFLSVMAEEGISYDELTQQLINQQQAPINPQLKAQMDKLAAQNKLLEEKIASFEKATVDQQSQSYKAALKQIELDVKSLVKEDPNFEAIRATNSSKDVVELIEETYKRDGILLSVEEAAQEVEEYLVEEATKLTRLEKIKKRLNASASKETKPQTQTPTPVQKVQQPQPMKTLTNATSASRKMSSRERAVLAFKGELKS